MMPASSAGFQFDPEWRITLFCLVFVPLMIGLGFWQLQRAQEKAALATAWEERQAQPPAPLSALVSTPAADLAYAPVQLDGSFLAEEYFLLDNRIQHGQFGYEVLGILQLADGSGSAVVNRGWIAGDASRRTLPRVPSVPGRVTITGHVYVSPGAPYQLAEQQLGPDWPKRIQATEMDKLVPAIEALNGNSVFPYPIRIDADGPGALLVDWVIVNMSPQKHQGYALQWFTMAAVLFVFYVLRSTNLWQLLSGSGRTQE